jgi:hypothetical protein
VRYQGRPQSTIDEVNQRNRFHRQAQKALTGLLGDILTDSAAVSAYWIRGVSNVGLLLVVGEGFSKRPGLVDIPKVPLGNGRVWSAGNRSGGSFRTPAGRTPENSGGRHSLRNSRMQTATGSQVLAD